MILISRFVLIFFFYNYSTIFIYSICLKNSAYYNYTFFLEGLEIDLSTQTVLSLVILVFSYIFTDFSPLSHFGVV